MMKDYLVKQGAMYTNCNTIMNLLSIQSALDFLGVKQWINDSPGWGKLVQEVDFFAKKPTFI